MRNIIIGERTLKEKYTSIFYIYLLAILIILVNATKSIIVKFFTCIYAKGFE